MTVDQTIKQRLVGAIVLVAVAVIFLPGILGKKTERKTFSSKISNSGIVSDSEQNAIELSLDKEQTSTQAVAEKTAGTASDKTAAKVSKGTTQEKTAKAEAKAELVAKDKSHSDKSDATVAQKNKSSAEKTAKEKVAQLSKTKPAEKQPPENKVTQTKTIQPAKSNFKQPSWLIQVGSFSSNANARSLAKKLEDQKMKAFVRPVNLKQGEVLYRVFVGPWFEKRQAESKLAQVTEITRLKPIVVAWQPNLH